MPTRPDPVLVEVVRGALGAVAEEIGTAVVRGAYSTMIKESGDVSGAVFDRRGRLVAMSETTLFAHVASLRACLASVLVDIEAGELGDGDLLCMNDPFRGGVHSNDIAVFRPVPVDGVIAYFTGTLVHVADLGGMSPGGLPATATDTFQEGLVLPPVFLARGGELEQGITRVIAANSRAPDMVLGDLKALIGGANTGAARMRELIDRFGGDQFEAAVDELLAYTERRTRHAIADLPPGTFTGEGRIDDDGVERDRPLVVRVAVRVEGDALVLDFSGTDRQAAGPVNASYAQATSAAVYGSRVFLDAPDIPVNEGIFVPLRLHLPEGSLVNPSWPAAVNARGITMMAVAEAMFEALSKQQPHRATAESPANHVMTIATTDPVTGTRRVHMDNDYGGVGARATKDGVDATGVAFFAGRTFTVSVEAVEQEHPLLFEHYRLRRDSGGAGRHRGGLGVERTVRMLADATATVRADKNRFPPRGLAGGGDGAPSGWVVNAGRPDERMLASKETNVVLRTGDTLTMLTAGGGGFGDPAERDPRAVLDDVVDDRVSPEQAGAVYGRAVEPGSDR